MARLEGRHGVCTLTVLVWLIAAVVSGANIPPTVTMNGYGMGPYSVSPGVTATDADGSVVKVEWYANGQLLGESTWSQPPQYSYWWSNIAVGVYSITAVATDNEGATGTCDPLIVEIKHPFGGEILTPTNGQVFVIGDTIRIACTLTNGDGTESLRYDYDGYNGQFESLTEPPYEDAAAAYSLGEHSIGGFGVQDAWNPNRFATLPRVNFYVIPARGFAVITTQPTNQIVQVGGDAVFSVSAFAELPLTYQWRFNGASIPNATNDQLRLQNVRPEQAGAYSVVVSTAAGAWPSDVAFLDVSRPNGGKVVFANRYLSNGVVLVDAPVSDLQTNLQAHIYAGTRMDRLHLIGGPIAVTNGYFDGGTVDIPFVSLGERVYVRIFVRHPDDPEYQPAREWSDLLETQTGGSDTPAPLVGLAFSRYPWPPPLTPDPFHAWDRRQLAAGTAGEPYRFALGIYTRAARVTYQWEKDGCDIPGASGSCERGTNGWPMMTCPATLTFTNLTLADAASYRVRIDNGKSITMSVPALLGIIEPPRGRFAALIVDDEVCQARLHGSIGERYAIQSSSNLRDWTTVATVTNVTGTIALPKPLSGRQNFYRARLAQ